MLQAVRVTLRRVLGEEPEILLRKRRDVEGLLGAAPFTPRQASSTTKLYVTFLSRRSLVRPRLPLGSPKERLEAVAMTDLEVFLVSRRKKNGFYGFPNGFVEETLGVSATTRNWSTVKKLVELARREHDGKSL